MALSSVDIIEIQCPDLFNDANRSNWIELAELQTDVCTFGTKYSLAVALRACHMYAIGPANRSSGESGAVSSEKEGDLSKSYNTGKQNSDLDQSSYGRQLQGLIKGMVAGVSVLGATKPLCS